MLGIRYSQFERGAVVFDVHDGHGICLACGLYINVLKLSGNTCLRKPKLSLFQSDHREAWGTFPKYLNH